MHRTEPAALAPLLERSEACETCGAKLATLAAGRGGSLLVEGGAGVGKTRLLAEVRDAGPADVDWLVGRCEPLQTPPPLGPWLDMLPALPARLAGSIRAGRVDAELFADLLSLLQHPVRPLVLMVEDLQWADAPTLDLLRYLGRRIAATQALLVLTWRESDLGPTHPLHGVLAGLDPATTRRLSLPSLSASAVSEMARRAGRDAAGLHAATGGNPYLVTQCLAAALGTELPAAVRDTLLARFAALPPSAREILEVVSLCPEALALDVLQTALAPEPPALHIALQSGLLVREGNVVRLEPDLARSVLAESVGPRAASLHAILFDAQEQHGGALAWRVHHAEAAGLAAAVVRLAPLAARDAVAARAHRQAAALYARALRQSALLSASEELALCEAHADECLLTNQIDAATRSRQRALTLARAAADSLAQGRQLRVLARIEWLCGRPDAGVPLAVEAIALLAQADPGGREWAMACLTMGQLHLLADDPMQAVDWVDVALPTLGALGDREAEAYALNTAGAARLGTPEEAEGISMLERALDLARDAGHEEIAARAWTNLAAAALVQGRLKDLDRLTAEGIAYCRARDLELFAIHLTMRRALGSVAAGRWAEGQAALDALAVRSDLNAGQRAQLAWLRCFLSVRRGDPAAGTAWLSMAEDGPTLSPTPWYFDPTLMRVEAAWLAGESERAAQLADAAWADPAPRRDGWRRAELALWRRRLGSPGATEAEWPEPVQLALNGQIEASARAWGALGLPYEQALTLADGDTAQQRQALKQLLALGAEAAARRVRARLRAAGATHLPRGPYTHSRGDRLGLTSRQREVLEGLRQGLSNREIAKRLHRSERTVEQHVAALVDKLGATDRHDAVHRAIKIEYTSPLT